MYDCMQWMIALQAMGSRMILREVARKVASCAKDRKFVFDSLWGWPYIPAALPV